MARKWIMFGLLLFFGNISWLAAQGPKFVELLVDKQACQGKVVARNSEQV